MPANRGTLARMEAQRAAEVAEQLLDLAKLPLEGVELGRVATQLQALAPDGGDVLVQRLGAQPEALITSSDALVRVTLNGDDGGLRLTRHPLTGTGAGFEFSSKPAETSRGPGFSTRWQFLLGDGARVAIEGEMYGEGAEGLLAFDAPHGFAQRLSARVGPAT
jgi:hypothetical protein